MTILTRVGMTILLLSSLAWSEQGVLSIHVKDTLGRAISGMRISTEGDGSLSPPTDVAGKTRIKLPPQTQPFSRLTLQIVSSPGQHDYVCISPWDSRVQIPAFDNQADNYVSLVVVERGNRLMLEDPTALRAIASRVTKENLGTASNDYSTRQGALKTVADLFGLSTDDIDTALKTWRVSDSYEKGLKNYYLAHYSEAIGDLTDAYDKRRSDLLGVLLPLADSLYRVSRYSEAVLKYKEVIAFSADDPDLLLKLASALEQNGDFDGAKNTAIQASEIAKGKYGESSAHFAEILFALGAIYINHGDASQGMAIFDQAIKLHDFDLSRHDFRPMSYLTSLAAIQMGVGKLTLARASLERAVEFAAKHGAPPEELGFTQATMAALLISEGHLKQADALIKKSMNILNPFRPTTEFARAARDRTLHYLCGYLIDVYLGEGRFGKHTGEVIQQCLDTLQTLHGPASMSSALLLRQKALWEVSRAEYANAEKTYGILLQIEERVRGQYHPNVLSIRSQLVDLYVKEKKMQEAEKAALEISARSKSPKHELNSTDMSFFVQLIRVYRAEGKPEAEIKGLINAMEEQVGNDPMLKTTLSLFLGINAYGDNELANAETLMKSVVQTASEHSLPYYDATRFLGLLEAKQGHLEAANSYFDKALKFAEQDPDSTIRFESQVITGWAIALSTAPVLQEQKMGDLLDRLKQKKPGDRGVGLLWILISAQRAQQKDLAGSDIALKMGCEAFDNSENATLADMASCLLNLGTLQASRHLYSESEQNLLKAVHIMEEAYDTDSPLLRPYLISLKDLYKTLHHNARVKDIERRLESVGTCPVCESPQVSY